MRFVVTAGPTREPIDPVRYLSNRSSGKMGYAIAEAAAEAGHNVLLISGPVNLAAPKSIELISVLSSDEMYDAQGTSQSEVPPSLDFSHCGRIAFSAPLPPPVYHPRRSFSQCSK